MRLLHSTRFNLREFLDSEVPRYAILSHTWNTEEVLFKDIEGHDVDDIPDNVKVKAGYEKIRACCAQAVRDGFEWVWIDTCCIDKSSSSELSESINSMYRFYSKADICYAFLTDVPLKRHSYRWIREFSKSRWFTRGWTLQELIAPKNVEFFGMNWATAGDRASLGSRISLQEAISKTTGIGVEVLRGADLQLYSVAQRMSWAALRETSRAEDRAYSLMGLFNVNMPMLYGEGEKAFIRLQEEIMKSTYDHTLFAWSLQLDLSGVLKEPSGRAYGILANSPDQFSNVSNLVTMETDQDASPYTLTNRGLHITLRLEDISEQTKNLHGFDQATVFFAALSCQYLEHEEDQIGIYLIEMPLASRHRIYRLDLAASSRRTKGSGVFKSRTIYIETTEFSGPAELTVPAYEEGAAFWISPAIVAEERLILIDSSPSFPADKLPGGLWLEPLQIRVWPPIPFAIYFSCEGGRIRRGRRDTFIVIFGFENGAARVLVIPNPMDSFNLQTMIYDRATCSNLQRSADEMVARLESGILVAVKSKVIGKLKRPLATNLNFGAEFLAEISLQWVLDTAEAGD